MPQFTTFRLYLLGVALLFAGYVALEYNRPQPPDWTPTYANKDKIPYGTYVLFDQLPRLLGTDSIEAVRLPVYSQLTGLIADDEPGSSGANSAQERNAADAEATDDAPDSSAASDSAGAASEGGGASAADASDAAADTTALAEAAESSPADAAAADAAGATRPANQFPSRAPAADSTSAQAEAEEEEEEDDESSTGRLPLRAEQANYLFVNETFELSRPDALALLQYVARGNDAFVAAQSFDSPRNLLRDSLGVAVTAVELPTHPDPQGLPVPDSVALRFTNPALAAVRVRLPGTGARQRLVVDSGRVGHTLATDLRGRAVLIRLDYGRGHFYLCTTPVAFTNYYLLRPCTAGFATAALAYLPARRAWWDEYQKQGRVGEQSLLRVVFAHEALRTAYYLALLGGLLLVLVAARRRQRIIPVIKPLPNTTLLFTRTVASLYRQGRSHGLMAEKKVGLFLDYLRTRFQETSPDLGDEAFRARLAQKSGLPRARVEELLRLVNFARTAPQVTDRELLKLSQALNAFRREAGR